MFCVKATSENLYTHSIRLKRKWVHSGNTTSNTSSSLTHHRSKVTDYSTTEQFCIIINTDWPKFRNMCVPFHSQTFSFSSGSYFNTICRQLLDKITGPNVLPLTDLQLAPVSCSVRDFRLYPYLSVPPYLLLRQRECIAGKGRKPGLCSIRGICGFKIVWSRVAPVSDTCTCYFFTHCVCRDNPFQTRTLANIHDKTSKIMWHAII